MSAGIKLRLATFVLAIGFMVGLIAWTAHSSWQRIGELQSRLTSVQLQSFQIADHFEQTILGLNNAMLRFGVSRDPADWTQFESHSQALDRWIDAQYALLSTAREKHIWDEVNAAFDDYIASARPIHAKIRSSTEPATRLDEFAAFEKQSQRILDLGFQLAAAHHESENAFLERSNKSLSHLRMVLLGSLLLLMLSGGGFAAVVYREMIAPLKTKLVQSQQLVERQEKLAALGMLAAGVAHEIRNPLTALKAWLFIQQKHLTPGTPEHEDAEVIGNEISRLERIVRDFLLFARPSEPQLDVVPADAPLREVQTLLAPQLQKSNIRLTVNGAPPVAVEIDSQQIKQVLINLIQNAADSIGQDGAITLGVRLEAQRLNEKTTDVVILEVADTGKGISPEVERRLFDPFFTTKELGTGLGLSIAARIVEKHGGALQYQTRVNHGTTFGIVLPRASS
jgi:signal transduction histidine kinase